VIAILHGDLPVLSSQPQTLVASFVASWNVALHHNSPPVCLPEGGTF